MAITQVFAGNTCLVYVKRFKCNGINLNVENFAVAALGHDKNTRS